MKRGVAISWRTLARVQELATELANLVQENLPRAGHEVAIRYLRHPAWRSFPEDVASVFADRRIDFSKNSWTSVRGGFVPTLKPPELKKVLWDKEAKVSSYRQRCEEAWLLIVARGFEPSTFGEFGSEAAGYRFESGFDRAFFLHHADEYVAELRVCPAS